MPFVIACSECKAKLKIADEHRGKTFNCPKCRAKVVAIEENAIPTPAPQTAPANASPAFPSQPQIAALKDEPKSTFPISSTE